MDWKEKLNKKNKILTKFNGIKLQDEYVSFSSLTKPIMELKLKGIPQWRLDEAIELGKEFGEYELVL